MYVVVVVAGLQAAARGTGVAGRGAGAVSGEAQLARRCAGAMERQGGREVRRKGCIGGGVRGKYIAGLTTLSSFLERTPPSAATYLDAREPLGPPIVHGAPKGASPASSTASRGVRALPAARAVAGTQTPPSVPHATSRARLARRTRLCVLPDAYAPQSQPTPSRGARTPPNRAVPHACAAQRSPPSQCTVLRARVRPGAAPARAVGALRVCAAREGPRGLFVRGSRGGAGGGRASGRGVCAGTRGGRGRVGGALRRGRGGGPAMWKTSGRVRAAGPRHGRCFAPFGSSWASGRAEIGGPQMRGAAPASLRNLCRGRLKCDVVSAVSVRMGPELTTLVLKQYETRQESFAQGRCEMREIALWWWAHFWPAATSAQPELVASAWKRRETAGRCPGSVRAELQDDRRRDARGTRDIMSFAPKHT